METKVYEAPPSKLPCAKNGRRQECGDSGEVGRKPGVATLGRSKVGVKGCQGGMGATKDRVLAGVCQGNQELEEDWVYLEEKPGGNTKG